jgi:hypothetical protein
VYASPNVNLRPSNLVEMKATFFVAEMTAAAAAEVGTNEGRKHGLYRPYKEINR